MAAIRARPSDVEMTPSEGGVSNPLRASGVGELSTVVCADKKGVAYAWEANMRGERDGAAGVPVALYGCLNRACCVSLGSVLGEWRCRARARFRARGAGGRG